MVEIYIYSTFNGNGSEEAIPECNCVRSRLEAMVLYLGRYCKISFFETALKCATLLFCKTVALRRKKMRQQKGNTDGGKQPFLVVAYQK